MWRQTGLAEKHIYIYAIAAEAENEFQNCWIQFDIRL